MILHRQTYIWFLLYAIVLISVTTQYIEITFANTLDSQMFEDLLVRPQKLLFNTTIFFVFLIYATKIEFLNPFLLIRYKQKLSMQIIKYGFIISGLFVFLSLLIISIVSLFAGLSLQINNSFVFSLLKLMIYCVFVYMTYILFYLITYKKTFSLLINLIISFSLLILFHGIVFISVITDYTVIVDTYWIIILMLTPLIMFINLYIGKRKEFLI